MGRGSPMLSQPMAEESVELDAAPTLVDRLRALVAIPGRILGALLFPDRVMPAVVRDARVAGGMLIVMLAAGLSAAAISVRLDVADDIRAKEMKPPPQQQGAHKAPPPKEEPKSE